MIPSTDYILNGKGYGGIGSALQAHGFQPGALRPFTSGRKTYVTLVENGKAVNKEVHNAPTTLPYDTWKIFDTTVEETARERLRAIADLRSRGLVRNIPNAMGKTFIQWNKMSRLTPATISMDPARTSEFDRPDFDIESIPLPIIHKDLKFGLREMEESQSPGGMPLDTTSIALATEEVMDMAEKLLIGAVDSYSYGGKAVYGYRNHPDRNIYALADPTDVGWVAEDTVADIIAMRQLAYGDRMYGPYMLYVSPAWDAFLDVDYSAAKGDNTLRDRIMAIRGIAGMETLDFLPDTEILMVRMNSSTVQELIGFDVQTFRWPEEGPFEMRFKVAAMLVPWIKSDPAGNSGIVHGTVA